MLCPQAVETKIVQNSPSRELAEGGADVAAGDGVLQPSDVAECVIQGLRDEKFWALPHPVVAEYAKRKATDVDRWLAGMQRFQERLFRGREQPGEWLVG